VVKLLWRKVLADQLGLNLPTSGEVQESAL
jgi:hypothetical protein